MRKNKLSVTGQVIVAMRAMLAMVMAERLWKEEGISTTIIFRKRNGKAFSYTFPEKRSKSCVKK